MKSVRDQVIKSRMIYHNIMNDCWETHMLYKIEEQVDKGVWKQVWDQVRLKIWMEIENQVWWHIWDEVRKQII